MKLFDISIEGKKYEYIDSLTYNGINYIAYCDDCNLYISSYTIVDNNLEMANIDNETYKTVKELMQL